MPKSSVGGLGRGFLRLDRSGPRLVMIVEPSVIVEPFDTEVIVVVTDPKLPAYGLPEDTVIAMALSKIMQIYQIILNFDLLVELTMMIAFFVAGIVVCDGSSAADIRHLRGIAASSPREHPIIEAHHA